MNLSTDGGDNRELVSVCSGGRPLSSAAATACTFSSSGSAVWRAVSDGRRHAAAAHRSVVIVSHRARSQQCAVITRA